MDVGPAELIIVLLIVLLIFGGAKLPSLARSMGQAAHEFRKGLRHDDDDETAAATPAKDADARDASTPNTDA
jgi:sec-independent protein translocase protein TatA